MAASCRPRRSASPKGRRRSKTSRRNARPTGETIAGAELKMMRELIVILIHAITDLFACLPKELYATEKVTRVEATLAKVHGALAERQQRWASEDDETRLGETGLFCR
jgi:hypothetical protein